MLSVYLLYALLQLTVVSYCAESKLVGDVVGSKIRHKTTEDNIELRKAAQKLLGLRDLPSSGSRKARSFDVKMAPKYMLDLYEKYKDGRIRSGKQVANTVRSIQAEVGVINSRSMFVFNLSSIYASEKILKAEVHLYKRHVRQTKDCDIYMEMNELGPTFLRKLDHRRIPEVAQGWQAADVTTSVEACLQYGDGPPRMMALAFLTPTGGVGDGLTRMNAKWLVRRISRPYLIVYSNDTQNITVDHIQPHIQPTDLSSTYVEPSTGLLRRFNIAGHRQDDQGDTQEENEDSEMAPDVRQEAPLRQVPGRETGAKDEQRNKWRHYRKNKHHNEVHAIKDRLRRSVLDNEIPEDPDEEVTLEAEYVLPKTHPGILLSRTQLRRKLSRHDGGKLIPYPEGYKKQRRKQRRQRRKHRKNRQNTGASPRRRRSGSSGILTDSLVASRKWPDCAKGGH
ncbi:hypothetical protein LSH36_201g03053 [Paralvinella palmiformis]|uniref:TGF-beta propeptide domain-containing protein n=1 Tax=Paralvinella palmiformis TaxID=53620 RepID=A0AAD9N683_9ANNE|nr:hypothetical protein LSH36_201g03053 [Paralvinella palmiformis]